MIYDVRHLTIYDYAEPVSLCHNLAHVLPRSLSGQECLWSSLTVGPEPAVAWEGIDYFGNPVTYFTLQEPHTRLTVEAMHRTRVETPILPELFWSTPWEQVRDMVRSGGGGVWEAAQYAFDSPYVTTGEELERYARESFAPNRPILDAARDLTARINRDFAYDPQATTVSTPLQTVLDARRGVCQDFAHVQIGCLRVLGLPARYVSGYLQTTPPPGVARLVGADASHAWVSVFCPHLGWMDFDPTNDLIPQGQHITLAWGRDYDDVSPIKGVILGGGRHTITVAVDVLPVLEGGSTHGADQ